MTVRVLLAEDERNIVESLTFVLSREGYRVDAVFDGAEALGAIRNARPDLLILDLMLPKLSGFEVLKTLRCEASAPRLPVLILTAKGQMHDRQAAEEIGVDAFLTKPFSNAEVVAEVARILEPGAR